MTIKKLAGVIFTFAVALIPILLWLIFSSTPLVLTGATQKFDAVAKATALSGLALLSFNIILSARLPIFERLFLGLDRAYRAHRLIGGSVLMLLMLHSSLITAKYSNISLISGFEYLKPSTDLALMLGKASLGIMIILVTISVYIRVKYQWFIIIQRLLGGLIFLGGYHALFVSGSDLRNNTPLFGYFVLLGGAATGLYVYRSLFHKSIKRRLAYRVQSVRHTEGITILQFTAVQKKLAFYAGQFAFFRFNSSAVDTESHPFSICSGSDDGNIRIAAKASGDYTTELSRIKSGDTVEVEGPYGQFSFTKIRSTKQVWVAGGIGVTPFLSMAHSLPSGYEVTLYYCVRTLSQAIFLNELRKIDKDKSGFTVVPICNDQNQKLTAEIMMSNSPKAYLLCAPQAMMRDLEKQLRELHVPKDLIYYEDFALT